MGLMDRDLSPKQWDRSEPSVRTENKELEWGTEQTQSVMSYAVQVRKEEM